MTADEWRTSTDIRAMLRHVGAGRYPRLGRLFACACCRRLWQFLTHESVRAAIGTAENYADGAASADELRAAFLTVIKIRGMAPVVSPWGYALQAASDATVNWGVLDNLDSVVRYAAGAVALASCDLDRATREEIEAAAAPGRGVQCDLLRDIFGAALPPPDVAAAWKAPNVVAVAGVIYQEYRFEEMPILGDALEEAGCEDPLILGHCRQAGPHVRGCWLLDGILGKPRKESRRQGQT